MRFPSLKTLRERMPYDDCDHARMRALAKMSRAQLIELLSAMLALNLTQASRALAIPRSAPRYWPSVRALVSPHAILSKAGTDHA